MKYAMSTSQLSNACITNAYNSYPLIIDSNCAIIMVYFIGMFVGILITIDYYKPLQNKLLNEQSQEHDKNEKQEDDDEKDNDEKDNDNDDDDDEDYDPNEEDEGEDEEEEKEEDEVEKDENDLKKEKVRHTIDIIYVYTDEWSDFVSKKSIYLRLQKLYPTITKFMVKEAMNIEPRYISGTQHNTAGYRYITEL